MTIPFKMLPALLLLPLLPLISPSCQAQTAGSATASASAGSHAHTRGAEHLRSYATPQEAVSALVAALHSDDHRQLHAILGRTADHYIRPKEADPGLSARTAFLAAYDEKARIDMKTGKQAVLYVGNIDWPLPFPLVMRHHRWQFDTPAGEREWQDRRIGANELAAIQVSLAYVDAQREYVQRDRNQDGLLEYAQNIVSQSGQHDGLYWPAAEGETPSPMGAAFAAARHLADNSAKAAPDSAGASDIQPFHGYLFRILTAQGSAVRGGAIDYMVNGKLIGGFALLAYPARYRETGIKTLIVNHDGVVYSKDLGPDTPALAAAMPAYNPDASWQKESVPDK